MFLVQLINYDIYCELADRAKIPTEKRCWPADAPVYTDEDDLTVASAAAEVTEPDMGMDEEDGEDDSESSSDGGDIGVSDEDGELGNDGLEDFGN